MAYIGKVLEITAYIVARNPVGMYELIVEHEENCQASHSHGRRECTCDAIVIPIVDVRLESGSAIIDRCPFCTKRHSHSPEPGHRVAHCGNGVNKFNGYTLRITV